MCWKTVSWASSWLYEGWWTFVVTFNWLRFNSLFLESSVGTSWNSLHIAKLSWTAFYLSIGRSSSPMWKKWQLQREINRRWRLCQWHKIWVPPFFTLKWISLSLVLQFHSLMLLAHGWTMIYVVFRDPGHWVRWGLGLEPYSWAAFLFCSKLFEELFHFVFTYCIIMVMCWLIATNLKKNGFVIL